MEILRVDSFGVSLPDSAELEHNTNLKEAHLCWLDLSSVTKALKWLKKCTNLRRLTLGNWEIFYFPSSEELCDFIMESKHLTFLHIIYRDISNCKHFKSLVDEVKAFVLLRRPNFKFYVSCCSKFEKLHVSSREFCFDWIGTIHVQLNEWHGWRPCSSSTVVVWPHQSEDNVLNRIISSDFLL